MVIELSGVSARQKHLMGYVDRLTAGFPHGLPVGPEQKDMLGRQLNLNHRAYSHLFNPNGTVSDRVKAYAARLRDDEKFRLEVEAYAVGYDIRATSAPDEYWVLLAQSLAAAARRSTGENDGHVFYLSTDTYEKHNRINSLIAYTLIASGACENGGGIINVGVVEGGLAKQMGMLHQQQNGRGGNWGYGTVSHLTKPELAGIKIGLGGNIISGDDLDKLISGPIVREEFPPLRRVEHPEDYVVNVGDITAFMTGVGENIIRSRTSVSENIPSNRLLEGQPVAISLDSNPLIMMMAKMADALGAEVHSRESKMLVRDPYESDKEEVVELKTWAELLFAGLGRRIPVILEDPDGDRMAQIVINAMGQAVNVYGTKLLMPAAHNLATYNPQGIPMAAVADMRAFIAVSKLGEGLRAKGFPITIIPSSPGYNTHHENMGAYSAPVGIEDTSHFMLDFLLDPTLGAPRAYDQKKQAGGDCASLAAMYMLGLQKHMWEGRNLLEQLDYIRGTFGVPDTTSYNFKPQLEKSHGKVKEVIAEEMRTLVRNNFSGNPLFEIHPVDTGIFLYMPSLTQSLLVRYSKSGSGFTINMEALTGNEAARNFLHQLGMAVFMKGTEAARTLINADPAHKYFALRDFKVRSTGEEHDAFASLLAAGLDYDQIIREAAQR